MSLGTFANYTSLFCEDHRVFSKTIILGESNDGLCYQFFVKTYLAHASSSPLSIPCICWFFLENSISSLA